jgi:hypothetical protein
MGGFFKNPAKAIRGAIRSPIKNIVLPVLKPVAIIGGIQAGIDLAAKAAQ